MLLTFKRSGNIDKCAIMLSWAHATYENVHVIYSAFSVVCTTINIVQKILEGYFKTLQHLIVYTSFTTKMIVKFFLYLNIRVICSLPSINNYGIIL